METMTNRAVANVSVEWLMKNLGYSVDLGNSIDFDYLIRYKLGWELNSDDNCLSGYYERICDSILAEGFHVPICVYMHNGWDTEYKDVFAQGNGHHRLCLAILLGLDSIPVCFSFTNEYMHTDITSGDGC